MGELRILFYGAGVLGSLYAAKLKEIGHNVTVLARGKRFAEIREHGIVLEDSSTGERKTTAVNTIEQLTPQDVYDFLVILVRGNQVSSVLPAIAANKFTPNVLFMTNNAGGTEKILRVLGQDRVLFGFPGAGGTKEGHVIRYNIISKYVQKTTFGELGGSETIRLRQINKEFKRAGFHTEISSNIDAWLKTHVALVSPIANAIYMAGGDDFKLACNREAILLNICAIREGFSVLKALGIPVTPPKLKLLNLLPESILVSILSRVYNTEWSNVVMTRHANAARDEMKELADEFLMLVSKTSVPTPAIERLYKYI
ncbi:ketopantoate reductase family protein [Desulfitobacterium sp. AusDCA]|uniref:ketopantoate reductase family protein n=1 Tax=Desulfitobacterium sp. AusDCA TaxID=3240383 RepID=UPI003DA76BDC